MANDPTELLRPRAEEPETPASPLGGTRAQAIQRLQIGLFGLFAMVLLVGLANIIMDNAQQNQARVVPEAASTMAPVTEAEPVTDPLADAGVVPDLPAQTESAQPVAPPRPGDGAEPRQP